MTDPRWVDVGESAAFAFDKPTLVRAGSREVVVMRTAEGFFACRNKCPHMGAPLVRGWVRQSATGEPVLVCQDHQWMFRLRDGECVAPETEETQGRAMRTYPARVTAAGRVEIDLG